MLDYFEDADHFYIVMEKPDRYIDLFDYITQKGVVSERSSRFLFRQIIEAVQYCLSVGVVHRDVKDENILIDLQTNQIKLIDFGSGTFLIEGPYSEYEGESGSTDTHLLFSPLFSAASTARVCGECVGKQTKQTCCHLKRSVGPDRLEQHDSLQHSSPPQVSPGWLTKLCHSVQFCQFLNARQIFALQSSYLHALDECVHSSCKQCISIQHGLLDAFFCSWFNHIYGFLQALKASLTNDMHVRNEVQPIFISVFDSCIAKHLVGIQYISTLIVL